MVHACSTGFGLARVHLELLRPGSLVPEAEGEQIARQARLLQKCGCGAKLVALWRA